MLTQPGETDRIHRPLGLPAGGWREKKITRAAGSPSTDVRATSRGPTGWTDSARRQQWEELLEGGGFEEEEAVFFVVFEKRFKLCAIRWSKDVVAGGDDDRGAHAAGGRFIQGIFVAVRDAHRARVHLYNATAPLFRELVFGMNKEQVVELATRATRRFPRGARRGGGAAGETRIFRGPFVFPRDARWRWGKGWRRWEAGRRTADDR
ncbi:hypothetical protein ACLK2E_14820 [Escherichia coli]